MERSISLEKPHGPIRVHFRDGQAAWEPGQTAWNRTDGVASDELRGDWVNLCDSIGYIFHSNAQDADATLVLPNPTKRDALKRHVRIPQVERYADCLLAFPGQTHKETAQASLQSRIVVDGNVMAVTAGDWIVWVNFGRATAVVRLPDTANIPRPLELPPLSHVGCEPGRGVLTQPSDCEEAVTMLTETSVRWRWASIPCHRR